MAESRLQRWARLKAEADKPAELLTPPVGEPEPSPEDHELALNETLPEREVLEKYGLPDPETLELGADVTGFMRKEIPELLRRKALRALWKTNPVLAVLDGLNDYDEDYTDAAFATTSVKTLYKVGQGMFDRKARDKERAEAQAENLEETPEVLVPVREPAALGGTEGELEQELPAEPVKVSHRVEPAAAETEGELVPRYRPRMRFNS